MNDKEQIRKIVREELVIFFEELLEKKKSTGGDGLRKPPKESPGLIPREKVKRKKGSLKDAKPKRKK